MNAPAGFLKLDGRSDMNWLGNDPIPAAPYYGPEWFALEREAIFKRTWLQVGHICELPAPGSFIVREVPIANASILITRGKDGALHAHHNVCTHRGTALVAEAAGKRATFTCRYHAWTFGADGELLSAPDFEQFHVSKADCALKSVSVDECGGLIFINLDPQPKESLRDFLGVIFDKLDRLAISRATDFTEYVYDIDANWKLNYDNFQENYHLRFIHPVTGAAAFGPENPLGYPTDYAFFGPHRTQTLWKNPNLPAFPALQSFATGEAFRFGTLENEGHPPREKTDVKLFPNQFIIGSPLYIFTHMTMPITPQKTRGTIRIYWKGEDGCASQRFAREYMMGMLRDVHAEDRGVITASSAGMKRGAVEHIHFQPHEILCRHLIHEVTERVTAYSKEAELERVA